VGRRARLVDCRRDHRAEWFADLADLPRQLLTCGTLIARGEYAFSHFDFFMKSERWILPRFIA